MAFGEFSMAGCAQDVHDLLVSLGIQRDAVLVGLSMGGYVCFEFLGAYQHWLRALVLVATQPVADSESARQARFDVADLVRREGSSALAAKLIPRFLGKTTLARKPEIAEMVRRLIQSNLPEAIARACYGLAARRDATESLSKIEIPTLIVAGAEDALIPPAQAETMRQRIERSKLMVVPECGHLINLEQPALFHDAVSAFLASV
jgi:pimeloyl-ACP methyl ester carboxylesterase